jgi:hypothetical protein
MSTNIDKILQELGDALKSSQSSGIKTAGIRDTATREQLVVTDRGVEVGVLSADRVAGNLTVGGDVVAARLVSGGNSELNNLKVNGKLEADTLQVKRIVSDSSVETYTKSVTFTSDSPKELDGKGLLWNEGDLTRQFVFKAEPRRLFSTENIDLFQGASYQINGVSVISQTSLGSSIRDSRLRTVGPLERLVVTGETTLADTVFVNGALGRLGINTDQPNAVISAVDNNTEVVLGATEDGVGFVGTWGAKSFAVITDNTNRITIQGSTTEFGNSVSKGALVKIHGVLEVDSLVADTRVERTHPIEFLATKDNSIFGKGLIWKGEGGNRHLFMMPNPDRLQSSESIDLAVNKEYFVNRKMVLNEHSLGDTVLSSSLTSVGTLTTLSVAGDVDLSGSLSIKDRVVTFSNSLAINDGNGNLRLTSKGITAQEFSVSSNNGTEFEINEQGAIQLGNKDNTTRVINAYGKFSVNISNPLPEADFSVDGLVVINGKKFSNGLNAPVSGQWSKGDIVWNTNPQETSYIGWVCIMSGTPGTWKPFGYIGSR